MVSGSHGPIDPALASGRLTIDLTALAENWLALSRRAPHAATAAVVKADAYGIGLERAALVLAEAGCHTFFVAVPDEGQRLRTAVRDAAIYVLGGLIEGGSEAYAAADLRPVLGSWPEIEEWAAFRRAGGRTECALHVDTGMNRLGLSLSEARLLGEQKPLLELLSPSLVMSHLACADTPAHPLNRKQVAAFRAVRVLLPDIPASLANSAGIMLGPEYHFDLVRPGIALYGGLAVEGVANPMHPVVTMEARVLQVRDTKRGETVGYGATGLLERNSRIAIVGTGYADGYHRITGLLGSKARAYLRGRDVPLVGRVSMDLIALDVTDVHDAQRGDWVELFGSHVPVDEVAARAGTVGYEFLTGLGRRLARTYVGETPEEE
jgi:alanine racemase